MMNKNLSSPIAVFGEVLFDEFPDGSRILGGAPFNVAWHLHAFGAMPYFMSCIGEDANGAAIQTAMQTWGMTTDGLQRDEARPTGTVRVTLENNQPHYAILDHQAYDFIRAAAMPDGAVFYHGTLALRHAVSTQTFDNLRKHHQGMVFLDVNLREPWWQTAAVLEHVKHAHWLKVNDEEFQQLQPHTNLLNAMRDFIVQYDLQTLIVTRGEQGAIAINQAGDSVQVKPTAQQPIVDTVGAGDAFAAVLLLGIQRGWTLQDMMQRAQDFASALVTQRGATVQDRDFYSPFLTAWREK